MLNSPEQESIALLAKEPSPGSQKEVFKRVYYATVLADILCKTYGSIPETKCRLCREFISPEDFSVWVSYWGSHWYPTHKECLKKQKEEETIPCQTIDADCNDCKHFQRGERFKSSKQSFHGWCEKFNKKTFAHVGLASGHACFEHRSIKQC